MCSSLATSSSVTRELPHESAEASGTKLAGNKRVFLVTDNDEPPGSKTNRAPARTVYGVRPRLILLTAGPPHLRHHRQYLFHRSAGSPLQSYALLERELH
jgi:hypothetical protein